MLASWDNPKSTFDHYDAYIRAELEEEDEEEWAAVIERDVYSRELWDAVGRLDGSFPHEDLPAALELAETLVPLAERRIKELGP